MVEGFVGDGVDEEGLVDLCADEEGETVGRVRSVDGDFEGGYWGFVSLTGKGGRMPCL